MLVPLGTFTSVSISNLKLDKALNLFLGPDIIPNLEYRSCFNFASAQIAGASVLQLAMQRIREKGGGGCVMQCSAILYLIFYESL
jgi:hypothetical protein